MIDSLIYLVTKAVGMVVVIKDVEAYQKELKKRLHYQQRALQPFGRLLAAANAALIATKHIDFYKPGAAEECPPIAEKRPPTAETSC